MSAPRGVIFTDLDGTLLDFETYRPSPGALEALGRLVCAGILTIPVSSKTPAELRPLLLEFDLPGPAVAEGGAVLVRADGSDEMIGRPRSELVEVLGRLAKEGWSVRGISDMDSREISLITGLDEGGARRAMNRLASEPFLVEPALTGAEIAELEAAVAALGAGVVRGGRFWHLMGMGVSKAAGMGRTLQLIGERDVRTAAVGDSWNDLPMLAAADLGFLLGETVEASSVPEGVVRLRAAGPDGFVEVVRQVLDAWRD